MSGPASERYLGSIFREYLAKPPATIAGDYMRSLMQRRPHRARAARTAMDQAHRYVLDDDFTELAARISTSHPRLLSQALRFCHMPFETIWLEWNDPVRRQHTPDNYGLNPAILTGMAKRRGLLLRTMSTSDALQIIHIQPVFGQQIHSDPALQSRVAECHMGLAGFELFLGDDAEQYGEGIFADMLAGAQLTSFGDAGFKEWAREVAPVPIGHGYMVNHDDQDTKSHIQAAQLAYHTALGSHLLAENQLEVWVNPDPEFRKNLQEDLFLPGGDVRFAVAVLTLLTDAPDAKLRFVTAGSTGTTFSKSKFLPKYEYKVVAIERPVTERLAELQQTLRDHDPWSGVRQHPVEGHWCYSHRNGRSNCLHARWERRYGPDGKRLGLDLWRCDDCGKTRWWRSPHLRGNPEIGVIEKGYEVMASIAPAVSHDDLRGLS